MIKTGSLVKLGNNKIGIVKYIEEEDYIVFCDGREFCCCMEELEVISVQSK